MEFDPEMQEGLRRNNNRFISCMTRIFEEYSHPFGDDVLISIDSLTYDTPEGLKEWDRMTRKQAKAWKKKFVRISRRPRSTAKQSRDFEDESSAVHQESSENSGADTSDTGEEGGAVASVRRKVEGIRLKNRNVDDGQILKKKRVPVDVILQGDERNIPKWITITTPSPSKSHRSTLPGRELHGEEGGAVASVRRKVEGIRLKNRNVDDGQILKKKRVPVDVILQGDERNIPKWITITTPSPSKSHRSTLPGRELHGEEGGAVASVRRKVEGIRLKNRNVDDGQILKKKRVPVDVILQGDERNIPKWITITTPSPSKSHRSTLPGRELHAKQSRDFEDESSAVHQESSENSGADTSDTGPVQWKLMSRKQAKALKKKFERIGRSLWSTAKQSRDFEDESSAVHQESSENSGADTSDTGEEGGAVASVRRKVEGIRLKNRNVDDGQILKKKRVPVDVILQGDERNIPKWITITTPSPSKSHRSTLPGRELHGEEGGAVASVRRKVEGIRLKNRNVDDGQILKKKRVPVDVILQGDERNIPKWITITTPSPSKSHRSTLPGRELHAKQSRDFEDESSAVHQESSENSGADTSDTGEEGGAVASVRRKVEGIRLKNRNVDDGQILKKKRVPVDVILQGDERNIPKWITITTPSPSKSHRSTLPGRELHGEEGGAVASVRRKVEGIRLKNRNVDDGQILKKKRVPVDVILQGDERNIPKWITITTPSPSKSHRSTLPGRELHAKQSRDFEDESSAVHQESSENSGADTSDTGPVQWKLMSRKQAKALKKKFERIGRSLWSTAKQSRDFEDESSAVHQESSENSGADTSDTGEEGGAVASVRRKVEGIRLKNRNVDDGQILKKKRVPVDVILQGDERNIPKWITITTPSPSKSHRSTLPGRELLGNQAAVCGKKLEFSNECSSSKYPQLQQSAVPISSNTVASPKHRPCPELGTTSCDSILGEYQSADEECSLSSTTLSGLYPAMVAVLTKLMTKHSQRKVLKYMFGHLRSTRRHSRRPKLKVTVDKRRGFRPRKCKPKKAFHSMCSCRSEDNQNPTFGNESREFCYDSCRISNSSGLVPYACADTNEIKMHYSDSSLEQHLASGKSREVCKHTAFPDVMDRMGETFLVEDKLQTIASRKNSEYTEDEKFTYKHFSEPSFITSTTSSDSKAFPFVKDSKTHKMDFCVDTSELCSSACSSPGNRNNSIPTTNCSPARSSNTMFICSQKKPSFPHKESFSSCKQSSSKRDKEIDAAFDELYYRVISGEYFKPLTLTRPLLNSQNHEEKGTLVESNLSDSERSLKQCDTEFEKLYGKSVPKSPGLQRALNFRKYEEIQMPETVNALVYSPVRTYSAISSAKRAGNFQNHPLCSPAKRLKFIPEYCFSSSKCQEISHSKEGNLQTGGMDFLSTYNCSKPSFFADRNCHCQSSGSHDSSQQSFLGISGTSLQESRTAAAHSGWSGAMENCSSLRNVSKRHPRVYRKLSYTDGKDQL